LGPTFNAAESFFDSTDVRALVAADFNNDSFPDVAMLQRNRGLVILLGNGRGQFAVGFQTSLSFGDSYPFGKMAVADFNRDNKADLAIGGGEGRGGGEPGRALCAPPRRAPRIFS